MAEALHKKQQITAALTELRLQVQNEVAHLRRSLDMKKHILESIKNQSMGMGQLRRHFGVASVSHTRAEKENLYS